MRRFLTSGWEGLMVSLSNHEAVLPTASSQARL